MSRQRLSMNEFCDIARRVVEGLPQPFHDWLENVVIDVDDWPDDELLDELEMEPGDTLFGLFEGSAITEQEYGLHAPNRIRLFKGPLEQACRSREELAYEIRRTVIHELAHHFGYSEEDLDDFESQPSPFDDPPAK